MIICKNNKEKRFLNQALKNQEVDGKDKERKAKGERSTNNFIII